jgi:hypothetical protein
MSLLTPHQRVTANRAPLFTHLPGALSNNVSGANDTATGINALLNSAKAERSLAADYLWNGRGRSLHPLAAKTNMRRVILLKTRTKCDH